MVSDGTVRQMPSVKAAKAFRRLSYEARQNRRLIAFGAIVLVLLLIGAAFWISQKGQNADSAVAHTVSNIHLISDVQSLMQDAEIGQRGYLLTGEAFYLEPYERSIVGIGKAVDTLADGVSDNSRQDASVAVLRSLTAQKLSELRQSVERRRGQDEAGSIAVLKTGQGKVLMDGIRDVLNRMRMEEEGLMALRASQARKAGFLMEMMVVGLALVTALLGLVAMGATLRRARSAEATRDELLSRLDRKLLAIMAADVVGYSRLMEGDEARTLSSLRTMRERVDAIIEDHHGTIVSTAGDSVLAAFASALSAIDCAVEIQSTLARDNATVPEGERLLFRIGINVGDVIVRDGDVFGDTVNVAARLEPMADAGGICISRAVRDHVRKQRHLSFDDLGFQTVKNIAHPVSAFRVRFDADMPVSPA